MKQLWIVFVAVMVADLIGTTMGHIGAYAVALVLAFVIARSIGRKGIKGQFMLEKGFKAAEPTVRRVFEKVPETVFNRLK